MRTPTEPTVRLRPVPPLPDGTAAVRRVPRSPRTGAGARLAARALIMAMEPEWELRVAATSLAGLAAGDQAALRRALARIQSRNLDGAAPFAGRAVRALRLALELTPGLGATPPMGA